jgi:cbb3-type cytochrome oxidase maturation protein
VNAIHLMLPFALLLGLGFLAVFIWMARRGQFDDLETPAHRILLDDEPHLPSPRQKGETP